MKNSHSFERVGKYMGMVMSPQKLPHGGTVTTTEVGSWTHGNERGHFDRHIGDLAKLREAAARFLRARDDHSIVVLQRFRDPLLLVTLEVGKD